MSVTASACITYYRLTRWGAGEAGAAARADANDVLNMLLIAPSAKFADLTVESL